MTEGGRKNDSVPSNPIREEHDSIHGISGALVQEFALTTKLFAVEETVGSFLYIKFVR